MPGVQVPSLTPQERLFITRSRFFVGDRVGRRRAEGPDAAHGGVILRVTLASGWCPVGFWWYGLIAVPLALWVLLWPARGILASRLEPGLVEVDLILQLMGLRWQFRFRWGGNAQRRLSFALRSVLGLRWERELPFTDAHLDGWLAMVGRCASEWLKREEPEGVTSRGAAQGEHRRGVRKALDPGRWMRRIFRSWWQRVAGILLRFGVVDGLSVHGIFGLPDAAATARLAGGLWSSAALAAAWLERTVAFRSPPTLRLEPCFHRSGVWARIEVRGRLPQVLLVVVALWILWALNRLGLARRRAPDPGVVPARLRPDAGTG